MHQSCHRADCQAVFHVSAGLQGQTQLCKQLQLACFEQPFCYKCIGADLFCNYAPGQGLPCKLVAAHTFCWRLTGASCSVQADIVFLSPPWGGPAYSKSGHFDVSQEIGSLHQNLRQLLHTAASALKDPDSRRIACFLPRNTDLNILGDSVPSEQHCLVERNVLNSHLKAVTVHYGSLADI